MLCSGALNDTGSTVYALALSATFPCTEQGAKTVELQAVVGGCLGWESIPWPAPACAASRARAHKGWLNPCLPPAHPHVCAAAEPLLACLGVCHD